MKFTCSNIAKRRRLLVLVQALVSLGMASCYDGLPDDYTATGEVEFYPNGSVVTQELSQCDVRYHGVYFTYEEPYDHYEFHVSCFDTGSVGWRPPATQSELDAMVREGETIALDEAYGTIIECQDGISPCATAYRECVYDSAVDTDGYSRLTRYFVERENIIDLDAAWTFHASHEFHIPGCMKGYVEFKVNVK